VYIRVWSKNRGPAIYRYFLISNITLSLLETAHKNRYLQSIINNISITIGIKSSRNLYFQNINIILSSPKMRKIETQKISTYMPSLNRFGIILDLSKVLQADVRCRVDLFLFIFLFFSFFIRHSFGFTRITIGLRLDYNRNLNRITIQWQSHHKS